MNKQKLFKKAVNTMDNYTKAVEMGLNDFANYYNHQMHKLLNKIKSKGLEQEFEEFALVI